MASLCQGDPSSTSTSSVSQVAVGPQDHGEFKTSFLRGAPADSTTRPRGDDASRGGPLVLIGGQEAVARQTLRRLLETANYRVLEADTGREAMIMMSDDVDVVIVNLAMPEVSGRDCIRYVKGHYPDVPVIVISRMGDVPEAVLAMKEGAFECFTRSCHPEQLLARVRDAARLARLAKENRGLKQAVGCPTDDVVLAGKSPTMQALRQQMETFTRLDSSVMITGAAGTGKTTVARWIHAHGARAERPFIMLHCGSVPHDIVEAELFGQARGDLTQGGRERPGRVELADGGTLFLEEIGELPPEAQIRLFHVLQDRAVRRMGGETPLRVDVRVIAATSQDPASLCRQGSLREDLLFQLDVLSLRMPALRDHVEDIPDIAAAILLRIARRRGCPTPELAPDAIEALQQCDWPGNTRELETALDRAFTLSHGATIARKNLAPLGGASLDHGRAGGSERGLAGFTLAEIERRAIIDTMQACGGNKAKTARKLGVSEKTIYNKIKQYNLRGTA